MNPARIRDRDASARHHKSCGVCHPEKRMGNSAERLTRQERALNETLHEELVEALRDQDEFNLTLDEIEEEHNLRHHDVGVDCPDCAASKERHKMSFNLSAYPNPVRPGDEFVLEGFSTDPDTIKTEVRQGEYTLVHHFTPSPLAGTFKIDFIVPNTETGGTRIEIKIAGTSAGGQPDFVDVLTLDITPIP
jgi:hypothetical protein